MHIMRYLSTYGAYMMKVDLCITYQYRRLVVYEGEMSACPVTVAVWNANVALRAERRVAADRRIINC